MLEEQTGRQTDFDVPEEQAEQAALLQILWRHKWLVAIGPVIGLVLGAIYYAKATPIYESSADVLVTSKRPEAVANTGARRSQFEDYTSTHLSLLVSPVVVNGALEKAKLRSLPSFADSPRDELTDYIIDGLSVTANSARRVARAGNILTVSFVGTQAEDCAITIRAILASYQSFLAET